jgi:hypothetical protein
MELNFTGITGAVQKVITNYQCHRRMQTILKDTRRPLQNYLTMVTLGLFLSITKRTFAHILRMFQPRLKLTYSLTLYDCMSRYRSQQAFLVLQQHPVDFIYYDNFFLGIFCDEFLYSCFCCRTSFYKVHFVWRHRFLYL